MFTCEDATVKLCFLIFFQELRLGFIKIHQNMFIENRTVSVDFGLL